MTEIPEIGVRNLQIPEIQSYDWINSIPAAIPIYPPVTTQVGVPIINIPGCVEAHELDEGKNENLTKDDPKGARVYCDAHTPSFTPIDYAPEGLTFSGPPVEPPKFENEQPNLNVPETKIPKTETPKCPTRAQELKNPIGKILEGNKKIVRYEMVGKECLPVFESLSIPDQIVQNIPSAGMVTTTASIAVVATSSALLAKPLADLLLRVVKPTVKKVMKKIATLRGKKIPVQSRAERVAEQRQRNHAVKQIRAVRPTKK